ncbi:glycerol-3-phosphate acyltransferase, partial [Staphylococcus pseudintermedius]
IMLITSFVVAILLIYRHMSNIKRIIKGTEPKIKWM